MQIYTAIVGDRDENREDILCFKGDGRFSRPVMEAKIYKVLPHKFFKDEITIWIDGNVFLKESPEKVSELLGDADIACFKHPFRESIWEEFAILKKDDRFKDKWLQQKLREQEGHYKDLPIDGLYECNFLIRRNTKKVNDAMNDWWAEICRWQWRDQVSFPYIVWKHKLKVNVIEGNIREHKYFEHHKHD